MSSGILFFWNPVCMQKYFAEFGLPEFGRKQFRAFPYSGGIVPQIFGSKSVVQELLTEFHRNTGFRNMNPVKSKFDHIIVSLKK